MKMKKILSGILALTACCVFTSCDLLPSSGGTGTNNGGGGLGNLGGNGGVTTTVISEKVANEDAWKYAFEDIDNHYTSTLTYDFKWELEEDGQMEQASEIVEVTEIVKNKESEWHASEGDKESDGSLVVDIQESEYLTTRNNLVYRWSEVKHLGFENEWYHHEINDWSLVTEYYDREERDYVQVPNGISWEDFATVSQSNAFLSFANMYETFSYNQKEKVYVYQSTLTQGFNSDIIDVLERLEIWEDEAETVFCKIWIQNGTISNIQLEMKTYEYDGVDGRESIYINAEYIFGVGEPDLPEFVMPENTQVEDATAWQSAFDGLHTHFTLDVKMEIPYTYDDTTKTDYAETTTITMIAKGDEMSANAKEKYVYEDGTVVDDYVEETYLKKVDGTYYQWFRNDGTYGEFTDVGEWEMAFQGREDYDDWNDWLPETGMMTTDVFADKYELFTYDETEKVYVYNGNVQTGFSEMAESAFDDTGFGLDDAETLCYKVWIKDGKVAKVYVEMKCLDGYDETEQASYTPWLYLTYTFGVGEPDLPEFVMPE